MHIRMANMEDIGQLRRLYFELETDGVKYQPEHFIVGYRSDVLECERNKGIGTLLINASKEYGKRRGADFIRTQVFPQNIDGMRFYERNGFCEMMKTIESQLICG